MIGELQAAVAAIGEENNTYFVFSSDNGAVSRGEIILARDARSGEELPWRAELLGGGAPVTQRDAAMNASFTTDRTAELGI